MQANKIHSWVLILGSLISLQLAGCAANVGKTIKVSDEQIAKYGTLSATDALAALEIRISEAMKANMPFYAPDYYRGASEILRDTRKSMEKKPKDEVISNIAKADAILDKGQTMMAIVKDRLVNVLAQKDQLDKDNVDKVFPKEYEKTISKLSDIIEKVELEKADNIDKDKIELIKTMQELDVKAIQYTALHESEVMNEVTKSNDGEKQVPATLAEAERVYLESMKQIALAPHDEALVQAAGAATLFAARHARYANARVVVLQNKSKESVEPILLEEEKRLLDISTALGHKDLRDQPIEKQAAELAQVAAEIIQGQQQTKQTIGTANDQSKELELRLKDATAKLADKEIYLSEKDGLLENKIKLLAQKDAELSEKSALLVEKDTQLKALNEQLVQLEEQNKLLTEAKSPRAKVKTKATK